MAEAITRPRICNLAPAVSTVATGSVPSAVSSLFFFFLRLPLSSSAPLSPGGAGSDGGGVPPVGATSGVAAGGVCASAVVEKESESAAVHARDRTEEVRMGGGRQSPRRIAPATL